MCNSSKVMLIRACRDDVALALRQQKEVEAIITGQAKLGRGPSKDELKKRSHKRQMRKARAYGGNLSGTDGEETPESSSAVQPKRKKRKRSGKEASQRSQATKKTQKLALHLIKILKNCAHHKKMSVFF